MKDFCDTVLTVYYYDILLLHLKNLGWVKLPLCQMEAVFNPNKYIVLLPCIAGTLIIQDSEKVGRKVEVQGDDVSQPTTAKSRNSTQFPEKGYMKLGKSLSRKQGVPPEEPVCLPCTVLRGLSSSKASRELAVLILRIFRGPA